MKINLFIIVLSLSISCLYLSSCTDKLPVPALDCSTSNIGYDAVIKPILDTKCNTSGCHDDSSMPRFNDYASLKALHYRQKQIHYKAISTPIHYHSDFFNHIGTLCNE